MNNVTLKFQLHSFQLSPQRARCWLKGIYLCFSGRQSGIDLLFTRARSAGSPGWAVVPQKCWAHTRHPSKWFHPQSLVHWWLQPIQDKHLIFEKIEGKHPPSHKRAHISFFPQKLASSQPPSAPSQVRPNEDGSNSCDILDINQTSLSELFWNNDYVVGVCDVWRRAVWMACLMPQNKKQYGPLTSGFCLQWEPDLSSSRSNDCNSH